MSLKAKSIQLGASDFGVSRVKNKKYYVIYNGKRINFGDSRYEDYTIHKDKTRKDNYLKRHKAIRLKNGNFAYLDRTRPAYWSYNLLWS